jgi:hypothetical protein
LLLQYNLVDPIESIDEEILEEIVTDIISAIPNKNGAKEFSKKAIIERYS